MPVTHRDLTLSVPVLLDDALTAMLPEYQRQRTNQGWKGDLDDKHAFALFLLDAAMKSFAAQALARRQQDAVAQRAVLLPGEVAAQTPTAPAPPKRHGSLYLP
jgi:hypothetical protein